MTVAPSTRWCCAEDFLGAAEAHRVIKEAMDLYTDLFVPKRQRH
jgi:hypothetical protein